MDDAFGRALHDHHHGRYAGGAVYRREHGAVAPVSVDAYFAPFADWSRLPREMLARVRGDVLDVGCGAGRAALALQRDGHDVLAVDRSPLAVRTAAERGVDATATMDLHDLAVHEGTVDTLLVVGHQLCAVDDLTELVDLLAALRTTAAPTGRLVADATDPTHDSLAERGDDLAWLADDVARHRFVVEYDDATDPVSTRLLVPPAVLADAATEAGWTRSETLHGAAASYAVVLDAPERS